MQYLKFTGLLFVITMMFTCQTQTKTIQDSELGQIFGASFTPSAIVAFAELDDRVSAQDSLQVTVKGKVNEVCQAKGCWMTIQGDDGMMVRFKDYGFFMPKDISGREVIMNGKAFYRTTPVSELQHYAEDAGKSKEEIAAITEPKYELSFLADGVILMNE